MMNAVLLHTYEPEPPAVAVQIIARYSNNDDESVEVMMVVMMIMIIVMCDDRYSHLFASAGLKARLYPKAIQRKVIKQQIDAI